VLIEKKTGKMTKRNLTKGRSMKPRPLLLNPERKYKYLCEEGSAVMMMVGADGRVIDANNALLEMSGYSRDEVVGKNALDFVVPEQRKKTAAQIQAALINGAAPQFEVAFRRKNGSTRTLLLPPKQLVLEEEGQRSILVMGVDITERKRAEEKLRQSEERYRSLFDRMLDGIYRSTREGRFVDVNPAFVKMFGYSSKQEMLDITDIKKELYFSPEERGSHILDTGQEEVEVYRMRRKDGSEIWVEDHGRYVHDEHGNIIYHEGILRDVTERKRLEEELKQHSLHLEELVDERTRKLRESEEELRAARGRLEYVVTSNPAAIYSGKPLPDYSDFLLTYLSERVVSLLGFEPRQFLGHPEFWESHVHPDDLRPTLAAIPRLFKDGMRALEYRFLHKDGTYRWIREEAKVIRDTDGKPIDVIGYWTDVTELKKMEQLVAESERLVAIGQTAAMVGHDLRNPLQGIAGAAYNIRRHLRNATDSSTKEMLAVIDNGVQYANGIVNDLLEFSREMQLQPAPTTPKSIVKQALMDAKIPNNITIEDTTADAPEILADEPKLRRVLTNLIENAIDAMPEGGKLSISSMNTQQEVSISVRDTGFGIPQDMMEKIWTPLYMTTAKGIGLGLPICRRIVEAHGGSISVESTVGKGTTFTLKLPIQEVQGGEL
jgi:PAS domain S-box-containing protein